ncbi:MAG: histidine phosphatase family protein, partial [Elusimicrobia bacterium]|nr:histidine phosphatase family protein [Elusimicrobiota bacterium]
KVYILRHAETMGNVTGKYSDKNQKTFSKKGKRQIEGIAEKLKEYHFDHIFVSPMYRTQHTILPYLKEHNIVAEIWPEIDEHCSNICPDTKTSETITQGGRIEIIEEGGKFFRLRDSKTEFKYAPRGPEECLALFTQACNLIKEKFNNSKKSILLVSHSCTGNRIMEILLGIDPIGRFAPANTAVTLLAQQPDGSFKLVQYNDKQFKQKFLLKQNEHGKNIVFSVYPEYFINIIGKKYTLKWKALNDEGVLINEGAKKFHIKSGKREKEMLFDIPGSVIQKGKVFTLEASLYSDNDAPFTWSRKFMFPTYKNLAGTWLIKKGDNIERALPDYNDSGWLDTVVPGGWEKDALPDYDGIAWYRLKFNISDGELKLWKDKKIGVIMGAIDDADVTYLNGKKIGELGKFPPDKITAYKKSRIYEFPSELLGRHNVLCVRVSDWMGGGGIWKGPVAVGPVDELNLSVEFME